MMRAPASTLDFALETIRDRHEHPIDPTRRLVMHVGEHSVGVARVAQQMSSMIEPHNRRLEGVVWNAGLMHDLEHFDAIVPTGSDTPLLTNMRQPIGDGRAELISGVEAYDYLYRKRYLPEICDEVAEAIRFGTSYKFVDGGLTHVFIEQAKNPLSAFIVAKADILGITTLTEGEILDATLRFFLERYPELAEHVISGASIGDDTFEDLAHETLPDYASEECDFMSDQYDKLRSEARIYLPHEQEKAVMRLFDIGRFIAVHQWCQWNWLESSSAMTARLSRALPATYKVLD